MMRSISLLFCLILLIPMAVTAQVTVDLEKDQGRKLLTDGFEPVILQWEEPAGKIEGYRVYRQIRRSDVEDISIEIDGSLDDWAQIRPASSLPYPPEDPLHIRDVYAYADETYIYLALLCSSSVYHAAMTEIFLDIDKDRSTGSGSVNWRGLPIGAELQYYYNHPGTVYRKQFDTDWEGPYPYEEFVSGNYADPQFAWKEPYDVTWVKDAAVGSVPYTNEQGKLVNYPDNCIELRIPIEELRSLTGYEVSLEHLGFDLVVSTNFDQFPTIGYGPKSPLYFSYGYELLTEQLINSTSFSDLPPDGLEYEYRVFAVDETGTELPVNTRPIIIESRRTKVEQMNVAIASPDSLQITGRVPENPAVRSIQIERSSQGYPETMGSGTLVIRREVTPGEQFSFIDEGLKEGLSYCYSIFSISADGEISEVSWETKDRSIPASIRGPIPTIGPESDYMAYFSSWDEKRVQEALEYDLVILHPGGGAPLVTREQVARIQRGKDDLSDTEDDILVIGYVSIGEDFGLNPKTLEDHQRSGIYPAISDYPEGPWSIKDYYYPRKSKDDTRGPVAYDYETDSLSYTDADDPKYQFPSYYVDMIDYSGTGGAGRDGLPDQNIEWGGLFVDPANENWQRFIKEARIETEYVAGLDWVLGTEGGGLGCDGVFLDTVGVSATWSQWFPFTYYGDYFWTTDGFLDFFAHIGQWYPDKILMPNRPLHFLFPQMVGKRYDDFRYLIDAFFWESYSADVNFWWQGAYADLFEHALVASQDSSDGRGFTALALDYWDVMIAAEEGGEFQAAPWYEDVTDQLERTREHQMLSYVTPSRSMAQTGDYVYNEHHRQSLTHPDLLIHSIRTESLKDGLVRAQVTVINQGRPMSTGESSLLEIQRNKRVIRQSIVPPLGYLQQFSVEFTTSLDAVGTVLTAIADSTDAIEELDEIYTVKENNNSRSRYIERYLFPREGWFPTGFAPDVIIEGVEFSKQRPIVGEPLTITITYANTSRVGIAPDSRLYYTISEDSGARVLGNIPVPVLLPDSSVRIPITYTPSSAGTLSVGIIADGVYRIIESAELNNFYDDRVFVISSSESILASAVSRLGPYPDPVGDSPQAGSSDIISAAIAESSDRTYFRIECDGPVDLDSFTYLVFIDSLPGRGYQVSSMFADLMISNGVLFSYTGEDSESWSWKRVVDTSVDVRIPADQRAIEYGIPDSLLYADGNNLIETVMYISDGKLDTVDDIFPSYSSTLSYPPKEAGIRIDGDSDDWESYSEPIFTGRDTNDDGINRAGKNVPGRLAGSADLELVSVTTDEQMIYILLETREPIIQGKSEYSVYFDTDSSIRTGYQFLSQEMGAEYRLSGGTLYRYAGNGLSWDWQATSFEVRQSPGSIREPNIIEIGVGISSLVRTSRELELFIIMTDTVEEGWQDDIDDLFPDARRGHFRIMLEAGDEKTLDPETPLKQENVEVALDTLKGTMRIDGSGEDWRNDPAVVTIGRDSIENRPPGITDLDIDTISYVFYDKTLFLLTTVTSEIGNLDWRFSYYLNTDGDTSTGYLSGFGYDILVQGNGSLYLLEDSGRLKSTYVGKIPIEVLSDSPDSMELAIPGELFGGFSDSFDLYLRFGAQDTRFSQFDQFGPVTLTRYNTVSPVVQKQFPSWVLILIGLTFLIILIYFNISMQKEHMTQTRRGDKHAGTDRSDRQQHPH